MMEQGVRADSIGPIQIGLKKAVHFTDIESSVRDIMNLTIVAVIDAVAHENVEDDKNRFTR